MINPFRLKPFTKALWRGAHQGREEKIDRRRGPLPWLSWTTKTPALPLRLSYYTNIVIAVCDISPHNIIPQVVLCMYPKLLLISPAVSYLYWCNAQYTHFDHHRIVIQSHWNFRNKPIHIFTTSFWLLYHLAQTFPNFCSIKELTAGFFWKDFDSVVSCWEFIYVCFVWVEFKNPAELATDNSSVDIFDYYSGASECQKSWWEQTY